MYVAPYNSAHSFFNYLKTYIYSLKENHYYYRTINNYFIGCLIQRTQPFTFIKTVSSQKKKSQTNNDSKTKYGNTTSIPTSPARKRSQS